MAGIFVILNHMADYYGNDTPKALQVARSLYDEQVKLRIIDDGYENLIVVADERELIRFPWSEEIWNRGKLERYVLQRLGGGDMPIPKLVRISEDPAYSQMTFLPGRLLDVEQVRGLPSDVQERIGEQIAQFAFGLHSTVMPVEIRPLLQPVTGGTYDEYLHRVLMDRIDPNPAVDVLAKEYFVRWRQRKQSHEVVVHDDLHTGNLVFDDAYNLVGVLDFGATCIGTPEQDLRQAYRLGPVVFESAAKMYEQLSGASFDREAAITWTVTQELGAYCREESGVAHDRAWENLLFWFPDKLT